MREERLRSFKGLIRRIWRYWFLNVEDEVIKKEDKKSNKEKEKKKTENEEDENEK